MQIIKMSKAGKASDTEKSDKEYILQQQRKDLENKTLSNRKMPDELVRRLHVCLMFTGINVTMIGYEIDEMKTEKGFYEYLGYLKNHLEREFRKKHESPTCGYWDNQTPSKQNKLGPSKTRWMDRSRTYKNIAEQMAIQWG